LYYVNNSSGSFTVPVAITPTGQLPAGIQSLEIDNQNRLYTTYQSSQSASGKGFYLLFAENQVFGDTILIADLPPEYVTRNSSQVVTKGNGDLAMFYAEGDVRNDTVICDIFMKRGNIYQIVPVELISFTASVNENDVQLSWSTASETNNYGFEIQRKKSEDRSKNSEWMEIGFVPGYGSSTEKHFYSLSDENLVGGNYKYRLKQIDFDGTSSYYEVVEVEINLPEIFVLEQNYPNPFNPSTKIKYSVPAVTANEVKQSQFVVLSVYDILGNEVTKLVNEEKLAGSYEVEFNASTFTSGVYFYQLKAGSLLETKKMSLLK
jgi:hypothetical protein